MLPSTEVNLSTSASGSQPLSNTKQNKIQQTPSSSKKNKIEAHPRNVRPSLRNKICVVKTKNNASVQISKSNVNSDFQCVMCNGCLFFDNHDSCILKFINNVNAHVKTKSGNACPLTRITTTAKVPLRKPIALESNPPKPVVTLVYSRKPKESRNNVPVSKSKINKSLSANKKEPNKSWVSILSNVPSSSIDECRLSKLFFGTVKFGNDHVAKIMGYGDYQIGNVIISKVGLSNGTSVAQSPQQNGVVERCNRTLIEVARAMLIYARAPLFLWTEAVATACFTQNHSIIRLEGYVIPQTHKR
uniref:Putative ribonuclease H-like domain-containing protein n=1 Tax=Tanacetum cinerariifolium TaxID=118510 RepID=A0A699IDS1_TANCI|nr:putative ribonuclease H-like domain-containing protein [Tanacetum cinerariifolium]